MIVDDPKFTGFEWDEAKRLKNLEKHHIDFVRAFRLLTKNHVVFSSERNGEIRYLAICEEGSSFVTIIFVMRGQICRIISARRAHRSERRKHEAIYGSRD